MKEKANGRERLQKRKANAVTSTCYSKAISSSDCY